MPDGGNSDASGDGPIGSGESASKTINDQGGSVTVGGATVTIPAGALASAETITFTETTELPPAGYTTYSPVYKLEPEGTTFRKPIKISLPYNGPGDLASMFRSRPTSDGTTGYLWIGGMASGTMVESEAMRLGKVFVANGVEYNDPPDLSCVRTKLVEGRVVQPGGVAVFFAADDCWGRPISSLSTQSLLVKEDGSDLSSEAGVFPTPGLELFVTLLLDVSSSTMGVRQQVANSARAFVAKLRESKPRVQVSVQLFDRSATLTDWQPHTLDYGKLDQKLSALATYESSDGAGTNLHGAIVSGLQQLSAAEAAFRSRNHGGAFTSGYLVVFTGGADTAGLVTEWEAMDAVHESADSVLAVGVAGDGWNAAAEDALEKLAPNRMVSVDSPANLERVFGHLAYRMTREANRLYLLGYCSPKAGGTHQVTIELSGPTNQARVLYEFAATGMGAGCSQEQFKPATACANRQCGGLGCGACDDRVESCVDSAGICESFCKQQNRCAGETITNSRGYEQVCATSPESMPCPGVEQCVDVTRDETNCGSCGNVCQPGATCQAGSCRCSGPTPNACGSDCVDFSSDESNCGSCGNVCRYGATCQEGICQCSGATPDACGDRCVDLSSDEFNCGSCGNTCPDSKLCSAGVCVLPSCSSACGPLEQCVFGSSTTLCASKAIAVSRGYAIDATEVTRNQYQAWLSTNPPTTGQSASCSFNTDYRPTCQWPPGADGNHPVVCVDWCDAYAYCAGIGKRLCGKIGGGANEWGDYASASRSQWYAACTAGGQNGYPYGNTYSVSSCNGADAGHLVTVATGSMAGCQSLANGYAGVLDQSGNVFEWEDSCSGDMELTDSCRIRGGSFGSPVGTLRCDGGSSSYRGAVGSYIGFRCCSAH